MLPENFSGIYAPSAGFVPVAHFLNWRAGAILAGGKREVCKTVFVIWRENHTVLKGKMENPPNAT